MRRRAGGQRRGAAATELALALPFLCLLFAVAADFCRVYHYTQTLTGCAYAAALYGSGGAWSGAPGQAAAAATQAAVAEGGSLNPPLAAGDVTVTTSGTTVTATVTYSCPLLTPVLGPGRAVQLTRQVSMTTIR